MQIMNKFSGIVKKHIGRGKTLGFPTANLEIDGGAEEGVYCGFVVLVPEQSTRPSLIFIGAPKTFGETDKKAEVFILDFSGDLYDKELKVELVKKLRGNIKFESQEKLIEQMKEDEKKARLFFNNLNL
ncbi:hypothetical protein D4R52_02680 [bacterium]|nr:MAG: hypothetical protein D4R52_02680 [bacterium]